MKRKFVTLSLSIFFAFSLCAGLSACEELFNYSGSQEQSGDEGSSQNTSSDSSQSGGADDDSQYDATDGLIFQLSDDGTYYSVTGSDDNTVTEIIIPSTYNNLPVKEIGEGAFNNYNSITTVTIPNTVINIGEYAFNSCDLLSDISIPESVISIGNYAFCYCASLNTATIGNGVTEIGVGAFQYCKKLTSVTIGNSVETINKEAFYYCIALNAVYISDITVWCDIDFNTYESNPLYYAENLYLNGNLLTDLPDNITAIKKYSFTGWNVLSITIPESVVSIENGAFNECYKLAEVHNLSSVDITSNIAPYAVYIYSSAAEDSRIFTQDGYKFIYDDSGNYYLTDYNGTEENIVLPESVNGVTSYAIHEGAFLNNKSLTSVVVPDNVTKIGYSAFNGCSNLTSITLPFAGQNGNETSASSKTLFGYIFGSKLYSDTTSLRQSYSDTASSLCRIPSSLTSVTINGGKLFYGAFYGCNMITNITLSNDITYIGEKAFYDCTSLTSVYYNGAAEEWNEIFIGLDNSYLTSAIIYCYAENGGATTAAGNYWYYDENDMIVTWSIEKAAE